MTDVHDFKCCEAKSIFLRLATEDDASFIYSLRMDESFNKYISAVDGGAEVQREWLAKYKERELGKKEYYFIICRKSDGLPVGTVRLYDFLPEKRSFCWGSWILNSNKTPSAALESALLVYIFAFSSLNFERSHFDVRRQNVRVVDFHRKLGAELVAENDLDLFFNYEKTTFIPVMGSYKKYLVAK